MMEHDGEPRYVNLRISEDDLTALIDYASLGLDASEPDPELPGLIDRVLNAARLEGEEDYLPHHPLRIV